MKAGRFTRDIARRGGALVAAGTGLACAAYLVLPLFTYNDARLASHLTHRIADLADAEAAGLVNGISVDAPRALRRLTELAASPRQSVAQAARARLDEWMRRTSRLRAEPDRAAASVELVAVAEALAAQAEHLGPGGGEWAAALARHLAAAATLVPQAERIAFLERCDAILASGASTAPRRWLPQDGVTGRFTQRAGRLAWPSTSIEERLWAYALRPGPLPQMAPPTAVATTTAPGAPAESTEVPSATGNPPLREIAPGGELEMAVDEPTAAGPGLPWRAPREAPYARIRPGQATGPGQAAAVTIDLPTPDDAHAREQELMHAPLLEAVQVLVAADPFEAAQAEAALRARGMSPVDLEFARRLPGATAAERLRLLDEIASRADASLASWLVHFAADEAADVRLRALSLLATSRDDALRSDVFAEARRDEDPRIRALAERLSSSNRE